MPSQRGPTRWEQATLVLLVLAAIVAFSDSRKQSIALLACLPCALSLVWRLRSVPARLRALADGAGQLLLGGLGLFALFWSLYPVLPAWLVAWAPEVAGHGLTLLVCLFLLGTPVWSPARRVIPAALGLLVVAALDPFARVTPHVTTAAVALLAYLVLTRRSVVPQTASPRRTWRARSALALFAVLAGVVAGAIVTLLPKGQLQVERGLASLLDSQPRQYPAFSKTARLGTIEELSLSPQVMLRVWTAVPQKLRVEVYNRFDGRSWHAAEVGLTDAARVPRLPALEAGLESWLETIPGSTFVAPNATIEDASASGAIRSQIIQVPPTGNRPFATPRGPILVRVGANRLSIEPDGRLAPRPATAELYGVVNLPRSAAGEPLDPETLLLPPDVDPRFEALAARLSAGAASPRERVDRTLEFLGRECRYARDVGRFTSQDPVAEFLFEKKRGYCEYFASAAAILLRLQQIPARNVNGFAVLDDSFLAGHYVVRESHAHSWLDVWLPGLGWTEIDPTPADQFQALHARDGESWLDEAREWLKSRFQELSIRLRAADWRANLRWLWAEILAAGRLAFLERSGLGLVVLLAALGAAAWRLRKRLSRLWRRSRRVRRPTKLGSEDLAGLLIALDAAWTRGGFTRPGSRTPLEHLHDIPANGIPESLRAASREGIDYLYRAHFGGEPVPRSELEEAAARVRRAAR